MAVDNKYGRVTVERGTIGEDEPVVVFRAQDQLLPEVIRYYAKLCRENGSPARHIAGLYATLERVRDWQHDNHVHIPQSKES